MDASNGDREVGLSVRSTGSGLFPLVWRGIANRLIWILCGTSRDREISFFLYITPGPSVRSRDMILLRKEDVVYFSFTDREKHP